MDGIRGVYQGGPFAWAKDKGKWTWEYNALLLATDPVAIDHVELGHRRRQAGPGEAGPHGRRREARVDPLGDEGFDVRQPQHIALAGTLGLGLSTTSRPAGGSLDPAHPGLTRLAHSHARPAMIARSRGVLRPAYFCGTK